MSNASVYAEVFPNLEEDLKDARKVGVQIEAKLAEWNVATEYVAAVPVADLKTADWAQVRGDGNRVNSQQVDEYAEQMRNGAVFPPLVVMAGSEVVVDGNTRLMAAKKARVKTLPVFRAAFPYAEVAVAFAGTMNQRNGRRLTPEEAQKVADILRNRKHTEDSIALELGYSRTQITNWRKESEFEELARKADLPAKVIAAIPKPVRRALSDTKLVAVFAEEAKFAAEYRPDVKSVREMVAAVKEAPSEFEAADIVMRAKAAASVAGPPPHRVVVPVHLRRFRQLLPQMVSLVHDPALLVDDDPEKRADLVAQARKVIDGLSAFVAGAEGR